MARIARDGNGWITLQPGFAEPDLPPSATSPFTGLFSGLGPLVPECTWTPDEIGVRHASGPKAMPRLADAGAGMLAGWRLRQDHPKRGLAIAIPRDGDHAAVLAWLVRAGELLTRVPLTGDWRAAIYEA